MNPNIDPSIDPSIEEQALYHVLGSSVRENSDADVTNDHEMHSVLQLNDYNTAHAETVHSHEVSLGAGGGDDLHMIGFDLENNPESHLRAGVLSGFREVPPNVISEAINASEFHPGAPKLAVKLVQYNPDEKTKRLGRPRKHMESLVEPSPEDSSTKNHDEARISTFRFDKLPVHGPGSRGGKSGGRQLPRGRVTTGTLRKRKQALLNFSSVEDDSQLGRLGIKLDATPVETDNDQVESVSASGSASDSDTAPMAKPKRRKTQSRSLMSTSRTTVLNNRQRTAKLLPGPLVGLYYDLYDTNFIQASHNSRASEESLALGYPIKLAPYASEIVYLLSYLKKFEEIVPFSPTGPQDIEEGLRLRETGPVSESMDVLFCKLAALVLNRKREISPTSQKQAIHELAPISISLGLPKKWSKNTQVLTPETIKIESETLDPNNDIKFDDFEVYPELPIGTNPFYDNPQFMEIGLSGLCEPADRLAMLVTLAEWSLVSSESLKNYITSELKNHDIVVDKETYYALHFVLKGFESTEAAKLQLDKQNAKKKKDSTPGYAVPTADPLSHPLRLRLDELLIGDCGFHVGRFYMCWMANSDNGGLASLRKYRSVRHNTNEFPSQFPSRFKLYVQDTYKMLVQALSHDGPHFEDGKEIAEVGETEAFWFEVASNTTELRSFVDHLALKLDSQASAASIPTNSMLYKPVANLHQQLSTVVALLESYDTLKLTTRSSRTKVDYTEHNSEEERPHSEDEFLEIASDDDDDYEE